jgi:hypothetical protein
MNPPDLALAHSVRHEHIGKSPARPAGAMTGAIREFAKGD